MIAVIGSLDGAPEELVVFDDAREASVFAEVLRKEQFFDRVDIKHVCGSHDLLALVRDEKP